MVAKGKDNKPHIGIFGRRNVGKSSLINAITGQDIAIVSPVAGTTTDPVKKSVEIFGIGPVILIDTAGIDDVGELGAKRIGKTQEIFSQIDLAVLVINRYEWGEFEHRLVSRLNEFDTPFVIVNNKSDEITSRQVLLEDKFPVINVSAATRSGLEAMISEMSRLMPGSAYTAHSLLGGIIEEGDTVLLVTPIDSEAPEGRMILPQMQLVRDVLDHDAVVTLLKEDKLQYYLRNNPAPKLVITDSQVFAEVSLLVPASVPLTSFSIVLAHHKGDFGKYLEGTPHIDHLKENDHILMLESCTHLTSCEDIGRMKIPAWLQKYTGKTLHFTHVSGLDKIPDISQFALVVQCGGCMVTRKQLHNRLKQAIDAHIPVTNYGMLIAYVTGIFDRVVAPFRK